MTSTPTRPHSIRAESRTTLLLAGLLALGLGTRPTAAQDLFLRGGNIVDPEAGEVRTGNLLIEDGAIVGMAERPPAGFAGETLDVSGAWIVPAWVDLHTHSFGNQAPGPNGMQFLGPAGTANRMLYAGVGAFLDLFSLEDQIFFARASQRENRTGGADIFAAGPCMTAPEGHCSEYGIPTRILESPESARRHVRELAAKEPDVVKIVYSQGGRMPTIERETLVAAVSTANELGIPTIIHIDGWDDVRHAVEAGATAITHVPAEPLPDDVIPLMLEHGTSIIPTLSVELGVSDLVSNPAYLETSLAGALSTAEMRSAYGSDAARPEAIEAWRERQIGSRATILGTVRAMHAAGIPVLTGTDAGNMGTIQGWSVHHELRLLVEAGLAPVEALAAGSVRSAAFLGERYGVTEGATANLVVLDRSPLEDISATESIRAVIQRGTVVDREALIGG